MNRFVHNNDFDKDVIFEKLSEISSKIEDEEKKEGDERNEDKIRELIYAQWIQGLKLSTQKTGRNFYF
jgi:hypothetical protein